MIGTPAFRTGCPAAWSCFDWLQTQLFDRLTMLTVVIVLFLAGAICVAGWISRRRMLFEAALLLLAVSAIIGMFHRTSVFEHPLRWIFLVPVVAAGILALRNPWGCVVDSVTNRCHSHWILLSAVCIGAVVRLACLDGYPYGYAGHAAGFAIAYLDEIQCLSAAGVSGIDSRLRAIIHLVFLSGQSVQRLLEMVGFELFGFTFLAQRLMAAIIGILTIPLLYAVASLLFDHLTGAVAAFLLAVSPWHITFSRYEGCMQIQNLPFLLILILLVEWARRRGGAMRFLVSGLWAGLASLLYSANFVLPAVPLIYLSIPMITQRQCDSRARKRDLILFLIGITVSVAPRLYFTGGQISLLLDTYIPDSFTLTTHLLLRNMKTFVVKFLYQPAGMHIAKEGALCLPLVNACFLVGLAVAVRRIREQRYLLLILLCGAAILPAVLSPYPAPRRFFNLIPVIAILSADVLVRIHTLLSSAVELFARRHTLRRLIAAVSLGTLALTAIAGIVTYFLDVKAPETDFGVIARVICEHVVPKTWRIEKLYIDENAMVESQFRVLEYERIKSEPDWRDWVCISVRDDWDTWLMQTPTDRLAPATLVLSVYTPFSETIRHMFNTCGIEVTDTCLPGTDVRMTEWCMFKLSVLDKSDT